jgi:hypothetical protein
MEFLRPGALWAIPLAGVPAVLHLWGRFRARPTPFTAVDLLREAAQPHFSTERLRRWLLLLARTLLVLSLVFFLSRPGFRGAVGGENLRGILLLDASYSLQSSQLGESAFDRARTIARALVLSGRTGDRWGLVIFSDRVEKSLSPEEDPQQILLALDAARPTFRGTDFSIGFAEAAKHLNGAGPVVLLSDLAAHGLSAGTFSWGKGRPVVAVEMIPRRGNVGVTGIQGGVPPRVEMRGWGEHMARTWTLRHGDRWSARGHVRWEAGRGSAIFPLGKGISEFVLSPDSLSPDDRWFFVSDSRALFTVCLVNGAPSLSPVGDETYFIRPVLDSLSSSGLNVVSVAPAQLSSLDLTEQTVVVLLNPPPLSEMAVERLTEFVSSGGGLWVTAGDRGGALSLSDLLPLASLSSGPVAEGLEWCGGDTLPELNGLLWDRVHADRYLSGQIRPGAHVVVRTGRTKMPLLSVESRGRGRVAFWGSTIDRDWTNLPAKPAFPVMVGHLLPWLSGPPGEESRGTLFVGDAIERLGEVGRPLLVKRPDGRAARMVWSRGRWVYDDTDAPGFYEVQGAQSEILAVNIRAEKEGNLARMTTEMFQSWVGEAPVRWIPSEKARTEEILSALRGRDLTSVAATAAVVLVILETILLIRRRKSGPLQKIVCALFVCLPVFSEAASRDRFVFAQVQRGGRWDPYPEVWGWGAVFLRQTTRLEPVAERRVVSLSDDLIFESPFLVAAGRGELGFTEEDIVRLRDYLSAGGFLFLDDTEASASSPFSRSARELAGRLLPNAYWRPVPFDHALFRSFFLLRSAAGRKRVDQNLQGLWMADRLVAVWSANDLLGALVRDRSGNPFYPCEPGGESQREASARLFVNIVMFSVTGTYKTDAVHQPFLEQKLVR